VSTYTIKHVDELEQPYPNWILCRKPLELQSFGMNITVLQPGEQIPEHDETERDQEEMFFILSGAPTLVIDGEDHLARAGSMAKLDPEHTRTVRNDGDEPASVLIISAPRSSGFQPMGWA
jgi:uncharacterized cupin superfamily protein